MGEMQDTVVSVLDIRTDKTTTSLLDMMKRSLKPEDGSEPSLTTLLLYDEKGLKLFEDITYLDEYYPTNAEIEALTKHADSIAVRIPANCQLVELGSGAKISASNLRKVDILLRALERAHKPVDYYALDLSYPELQRTFAKLDASEYRYVKFHALHGTYDDGLAWLAKPQNRSTPTCVLTLGSSLGNFERQDAAEFLARIKDVLSPTDMLIVGLDSCQEYDRVLTAYNDAAGVTDNFYRNGLDHANRIFGRIVFRQDDWSLDRNYDQVDHKHEAAYLCISNVNDEEYQFRCGDRIKLEYACKYSEEQRDKLWHAAGLLPQLSYGNNRKDYFLHVLSPCIVKFNNQPAAYAASPVPALEDWQMLWNAWDTVTKSMVPHEELLNKPIQLRNNLIFYLGHIPAFADIHFTRATGARPTDPVDYAAMFERGIDPDVDDPEKCHDHSPIPAEWPPLNEILEYEVRVRDRIVKSITSGIARSDKKLSRSLWLAYEHEAMHLETFLYMLLQSQRILPPAGRPVPDFEFLAHAAATQRQVNEWHEIPAAEITVGIDDPENNLPPERYFGWDNERPARKVQVSAFSAQSRCISIGEYARFLEDTGANDMPASWISMADNSNVNTISKAEINGDDKVETSKVLNIASSAFLHGKAVRTVYGPVALRLVLDWPVMASFDELAAYAEWAGGRIPTFEEVRSIYHYVEDHTIKPVEIHSNLISAVNGHLCNDGVEETPPPTALSSKPINGAKAEFKPEDTFIDLSHLNIGFKNWHTTAITGEGNRLRGQCDTGGLWEWTSSPLTKFEGFKAMELYPGYSADFFDNKHNICLGGSWATVPRIAGRKSFVNWYQRNYPYTWATARLARDLA